MAQAQTFSTAQLVKLIGSVARDPGMTSERVRHWSREGFLRPLGDRHPGTGRRRRYSPETACRAAVLSRLADLGFRITGLEPVVQDIVKRVDHAHRYWRRGHGHTFLVIAFGRAPAVGAPLQLSIRTYVGIKQLAHEHPFQDYPDYICIDLGRIFQAIEDISRRQTDERA